jgi:phenylalanyl-tRNA synthetase beta chain
MKISLNWIREYLDIELSPHEIGEMLTDIGLELEGMEAIQSVKGALHGIVVGEVLACEKHPNADKLTLTRVHIGNGQELRIVCGAPNVAAGQKVLVATVGATLYPLEGEPWTIKQGKIRGEISEGMICAEDELGLGRSHDGILVLPDDAAPGMPASEYLNVETDYVYEIGLTPNRSDATNHIGVARDLAARLRVSRGHNGVVKLPSVEDFVVDNVDLALEIVVEKPEACPRYAGVSIQGVVVGESPEWLQRRLRAIGMRPINNIVDATNFVLHELGQPLHAFDLEKIGARKIIVKTLPAGSAFTTLDEVTRTLSDEDLMICDGQSHGMCIAGVFGGMGTGVTEHTRDIFLESAHFNAKYVRLTSMRHNLRTDAAKIFEKGSDPNIVVYALKRAALLIKALAGGKIASPVIDWYPVPIERAQVRVAFDNVRRLIGAPLPTSTIKSVLDALDMHIVAEDDDRAMVTVPTNKVDVTREADIIEEILRIYGFNNVPSVAKITTTMSAGQYPDPAESRNLVAEHLVANGFCEMMALSLSESRYYQEYLPAFSEEELVFINNTSNAQLDVMRPIMLFSGLEAIAYNQNRQHMHLKLFEFGRVYLREKDGNISESNRLSLFLCGDRYRENWLNPAQPEVGFYTVKAFVQLVMYRLGVANFQETPLENDTFHFGLRRHRGPRTLADFGKVSPRLVKKLGIRGEVYYADLHWDELLAIQRKHQVEYKELNKFPTIRRDLALIIDNSVKFVDIVAIAQKVGQPLIKEIDLFDVYENERQLGAGKKSYAISLLFEDPHKTLQDKEVDKVMDALIGACSSRLGATVRR